MLIEILNQKLVDLQDRLSDIKEEKKDVENYNAVDKNNWYAESVIEIKNIEAKKEILIEIIEEYYKKVK